MKKNKNIILIWLILAALIIISTVIIGGYTRLSNAGLSIVEWKPITGIYFPIAESSWIEELNKYKASPEYRDVNIGISINEFKKIYIIEYLHRLIGRLAATIFILPFIFFWLMKYLNNKEIKIGICISLLILLQGIIGWYMVSSGIADIPYVSHFRLALHLIIANIIYSLIFWMICNKFDLNDKFQNIKNKYNFIPIIAALILLAMVFCQIFIGGLVAGSKAGFVYNTFPRMDGRLIPPEIWELNFKIESLSNILYIQFIHRSMAYMVGLFSMIYSFYMIYIYRKNNRIVISTLLLSLAIFCQIIFGILTLLHVVPLGLALFHQFFSIIVLSIIIWNIYIIRYSMKSIDSEI